MTLRTNTIDHLSEIHSDWGYTTAARAHKDGRSWLENVDLWAGGGLLDPIGPTLLQREVDQGGFGQDWGTGTYVNAAILTSCSSFTQVERIQIRLIPILIDHLAEEAEEGEQGAEE